MAITFRGVLQPNDGAFVEVPPRIMAELGGGKRPPVRVLINGAVELRTTIAVYGGKSLIGLRQDIRAAAGVAPGEMLELTVELDDRPRTVEVPDDLAAALAADPEAQRIFEALSFTNRKEYAAWVSGAKRDETRKRRVREAPGLLKSGRRTPL